jgi:hypothetical protein
LSSHVILELSKFGSLIGLGIFAVLEGTFSVGIKICRLDDGPIIPHLLKFVKLCLKSYSECVAFCISGFSGGSEGLVECMLAVIVPDGSDGPSDFFFLGIESINLANISIEDSLSGISKSLVNGSSSAFEGSSPCGGLLLNISGHGSPL